jgi:hypothetical protein
MGINSIINPFTTRVYTPRRNIKQFQPFFAILDLGNHHLVGIEKVRLAAQHKCARFKEWHLNLKLTVSAQCAPPPD